MIDIKAAIEDLSQDRLKNLNMINFIINNSVDLIEKNDDSYIARGKSDEYWVYNSCNTPETYNKLLSYVPSDKYFVVQSEWERDLLIDKGIDWEMKCNKLYLEDDVNIENAKHVTRVLGLDDVDYIYENSKYSDISNKQYIIDRITKDTALGVFERDELLGWAMIHDDGSIGFLNVMDQHRRKGIARSLMINMIKSVRDKGQVPYAHVEDSNKGSMGLLTSLGFTKLNDIYWIKTI